MARIAASISDWEQLIANVIGKPFVINARGPEAFDCAGIVFYILKELGTEISVEWQAPADPSEREAYWAYTAVEIENQTYSPDWKHADVPLPGDAVGLSRNRTMTHVGILTPFGILHATEKFGVVLNTENELRSMGYRRIEYYSWAK